MCTCITFKSKDVYFGRNLDLEYRFGEKVVITPRQFHLTFKKLPEMKVHYAMIGMASVQADYPLYAEAVNEKGLGMAGLNFPGNAVYMPEKDGKVNVAPYELIPWLLGQCETTEQARKLLEDVNLLDLPFAEGMPLAPLHWMIADKETSIVLESVAEGIRIYDNPYGVLTNNPPFPYYQVHLGNYRNLSGSITENMFARDVNLPVYGQGLGAVGLPGDFSPVSRFVKAVFLRANSVSEEDELSSVSQFFHILDGVAMVRGSVITEEGCEDITTYSCCVNMEKGIYYYKTYENSQIQAVRLWAEDIETDELKIFALLEEQSVNWNN